MNIYDTANKLAQELKQSEEYVNYKMAKEALNLNPELKKKIEEFETARYEAQIVISKVRSYKRITILTVSNFNSFATNNYIFKKGINKNGINNFTNNYDNNISDIKIYI